MPAMDMPKAHCDLIEKRIPTAQTPAAKAKRDRLFNAMDVNGCGFVTLSEVNGGIPPLLEKRRALTKKDDPSVAYLVPMKDVRPAIKAAFLASKKLASMGGSGFVGNTELGAGIDRREFHAFVIGLRSYFELDVLFEAINHDYEGGKLSWKDCKQALPSLEAWGISEQQLRQTFRTDQAPPLPFAEFAQWYLATRYGRMKPELDAAEDEKGAVTEVLKAFQGWDTDGSGMIPAVDLARVLMALDPSFTMEQAMELFTAGNMNKGGRINYSEFTQWVTQF